MSITLPVVDLSNAVVGTSGTIPLQSLGLVAVPSQKPPYLQVYNDSGAGLLITLTKSSQQFYLGAKGHSTIAISNDESEIKYSVLNISTNIQVNQLYAVYYYPGESVSDFTPLGTSAVSQQATTLLNVGNPFGTEIFFAQPVGDTGVTGASVITNSGKIILGDGFVGNGHISIVGATTQDTQVDAGSLIMHDLSNNQAVSIQAGSSIVIDLSAATGAVSIKTATNTMAAFGSKNVHLVGTTAGSIDLYQDFSGDIKRVILVFNAYRNATATPQVMAIPVPFIKGVQMMIGNINCTMACLAGGVAQNINHYANGVQTVATSVTAGNTAECATAFDSVSFVNSGASPTTCIVTLLGS